VYSYSEPIAIAAPNGRIWPVMGPDTTRASLILRLPVRADVRAWDEFAAIYAPLVYRLARKRGLQPCDADDLVQEVLAAVAKWIERDDRGSFRAWLCRIARNTTVNFLTRRKHRIHAIGGDDAMEWLSQQPERDLDGFDEEYQREVFRWAAAQVRTDVTDATWAAFWETTRENQPIDQVARELGMSIGSVYIARSRVMARLRDAAKCFEKHR
jgi:RNA polymerase sigma-70 factor (ECF subfamily)